MADHRMGNPRGLPLQFKDLSCHIGAGIFEIILWLRLGRAVLSMHKASKAFTGGAKDSSAHQFSEGSRPAEGPSAAGSE